MDDRRFGVLLARMYEAALRPETWSEVLGDLGGAFGGPGAVMFVEDPEFGTRVLAAPGRVETMDDYARNWIGRDALQAPMAPRSEGEVVTDWMLVPREVLRRTDYFNDYLLKHDIPNVLGGKVWEGPRSIAVVSVARGRHAEPYGADDIRDLGTIFPHLQRAFDLTQRMAWRRAGSEMLDQMRCATVLLDQFGSPAQVNAAAERLLAGVDGLALARDGLQAADPAINRALAGLIGAAIRGDAAGLRPGGALAVPRPSGRPAYAVLVAPVGLEHDWFLSRRPRAIVTIVAPDQAPGAAAEERLRALYGLTRSEAALARGLASGRDLAVVALELGLTIDSARQYLKRVFSKTGTGRQHDLTRLLTLIGMAP